MEIGIIAMRYAKAWLTYAQQTGTEETMYRLVRQLSQQLGASPRLRQTLQSPVVRAEDKLKLLCTAATTDGQTPVNREFTRFVTLVMRNRREEFMRFICLTFIHLYQQAHHIGVGRLVTAVPVSREVAERIRQKAAAITHARQMQLVTEVDPQILGGFLFDINHYRLDASVATQLKQITRQFIDRNRRIV